MLVLDEPVNCLDPEGVAWIRGLPRSLATEGRTVFLSSHLMSGWTLLCAATAMVGFGVALTAAYVRHSGRASLDSAAYTQSGIFFAQLAIGVLGVLMMTGEYATGSIRSTLAAAPQRWLVLAAKITVFVAVAFATGLIASLAAMLAGHFVLARAGMTVDLATSGSPARSSAAPCI